MISIKFFDSSKNITLNSLSKLHCKNITLTYHNLPDHVHVKDLAIQTFLQQISEKLVHHSKEISIKNIILSKEPYNYDKYPQQVGKVHIHGLICLNKLIRIRSPLTIAKIFSFKLLGQTYYPHISPLSNYQGYLNYITKHQQEDPNRFDNPEYYFVYEASKIITNIVDDLNFVIKSLNKITLSEFNDILSKYNVSSISKNYKMVTLCKSLIQTNKERVEDMLYKPIWLKFSDKDYQQSEDYKMIVKGIKEAIAGVHKYSPLFYGDSNTGKTSMIKAALSKYESDQKLIGKNCRFMIIKHLQELSKLNFKEFGEYDNVCLVFDDVTYRENEISKDPDALKSLFEGPEGESALRCLYGVFSFPKNIRKIFVMNTTTYNKFVELSQQHQGIKERIKSYHIKQTKYKST